MENEYAKVREARINPPIGSSAPRYLVSQEILGVRNLWLI